MQVLPTRSEILYFIFILLSNWSANIFEVNTKSVISDEQELSKIKEFGIQAPPGFLFSINGEGFHIGRTGMFYLSEENFIFESIGICDEKDPFIIDYKIKN